MTHCNAGALATAGSGSALGVIRMAVERGHKLHVLVPETRPIYKARGSPRGNYTRVRPAHAHHRQHGGTFYEDGKRRRGRRRRGPRRGPTAIQQTRSELIKSRCLRANMAFRFTLPRRFRPSI